MCLIFQESSKEDNTAPESDTSVIEGRGKELSDNVDCASSQVSAHSR